MRMIKLVNVRSFIHIDLHDQGISSEATKGPGVITRSILDSKLREFGDMELLAEQFMRGNKGLRQREDD